ncbi:hypothetical protein [Lishizhenia sp.]|uniref:hypothetical protein n=1 Tax=Lishizhenia sp. TaxID=2497594 RepID=UPI00299E5613|nr:hypothetical protein [Lishizhenia sp.]MDX1446788.1 hypothetical protein [Lishizhenia sp.]
MKLKAHFYLLNIDFSPEYAEAHHNGDESENNRKYEWEDALSLKNAIAKLDVFEGEYPLQGELPNGEAFNEAVPNMTLFEALGEDETRTYFAVSSSIIDHYTIDEEEDAKILKVYLKDYEPLANPIPGVYIASQDYPKNLILEYA